MEEFLIIACAIIFFAFTVGFLMGRYLSLFAFPVPWLIAWLILRPFDASPEGGDGGDEEFDFIVLALFVLLPGIVVASVGILLGWLNRRKELASV